MLDAYGQLKRDLSATDNLSITDVPPKNVDKGAVAVDLVAAVDLHAARAAFAGRAVPAEGQIVGLPRQD